MSPQPNHPCHKQEHSRKVRRYSGFQQTVSIPLSQIVVPAKITKLLKDKQALAYGHLIMMTFSVLLGSTSTPTVHTKLRTAFSNESTDRIATLF